MEPTIEKERLSPFVPYHAFSGDMKLDLARWSSLIHIDFLPSPSTEAHTLSSRRLSLQSMPTSPEFTRRSLVSDNFDFEIEKGVLKNSSSTATLRRNNTVVRTRWAKTSKMDLNASLTSVQVHLLPLQHGEWEDKRLGFWAPMREIYPSVTYKSITVLGLVIYILSGNMTSIFSFLLSRLMFEDSIGAQNTPLIDMHGGIVFAIAAINAILLGLEYLVMETAAMAWVTKIREEGFAFVISQDKTWFDRPQNTPVRLTQILIKDGDDALTLIATILGLIFVVIAMLGVGLIWALVQGR